MSIRLKFILFSLVCLLLFFSPLFIHAQEGFFRGETATEIIHDIYWFGVGIVGFAAVVAIVIAGIMYMQSYGDPKKITTAKQLLGSALIGVILLLFSYTILRTINPALVRLREPMLEVEVCKTEGQDCDPEKLECCPGLTCSPTLKKCTTFYSCTNCNLNDTKEKCEICSGQCYWWDKMEHGGFGDTGCYECKAPGDDCFVIGVGRVHEVCCSGTCKLGLSPKCAEGGTVCCNICFGCDKTACDKCNQCYWRTDKNKCVRSADLGERCSSDGIEAPKCVRFPYIDCVIHQTEHVCAVIQ